MAKKKTVSYEQSGVSIDANDEMVRRIGRSLKSTYGPRVINLENGFAGLFRIDSDKKFKKNYKHPMLVACTDGVGTKILIAQKAGRFGTIGIDLVAMSVNDMIVQGAEPLFFPGLSGDPSAQTRRDRRDGRECGRGLPDGRVCPDRGRDSGDAGYL
jgi:phosphoribosylaminoimidazole (AIR) synthetase